LPVSAVFVVFNTHFFPAYSWVLAKRLLSGWLVGKSCLSVRVRQRAARPECARPPCVSTAVERRRREDRVTIPGFLHVTAVMVRGVRTAAVREHGRRGATAPSV